MYDIRSERLPQNLSRAALGFAEMALEQLERARIAQVRKVVLLPPTYWRRQPTYMRVYVVANARKSYSLVERLSRVLAPVYVEMLILPEVHVIPVEQWKLHEAAKTEVWRELQKQGLVVYEQRGE